MTLYLIKFGLGGGFGGATEEEVLDCKSLKDATDNAYIRALEHAAGYEGSSGFPDITTIIQDEECSEEEAVEIYNEEMESLLDYSAEEYNEEKYNAEN